MGSESQHLVMCVDDDSATLDLLARFLRTQNIRAITTTSGVEALKELDTLGTQVEIIFVDLAMPDMSGYELADAIRRNPAIASIPIVAVTARTDAASDELAINSGIVQVLSKPFRFSQLLEILATNGVLS